MKLPLLSLLIFMLVGCQKFGETSSCNLRNIQIKSDDVLLNADYSAKSGLFNVQFRNEDAPNVVDVFPDPLVVVKNLKTASACEIVDANGIWSGKAVYVDNVNQVLLLNEYSGSTAVLILYDMTTCKRLDEINVSGSHFEVATNHIRTGLDCSGDNVSSCQRISEIALNNQCEFSR